MLRRLMQSLGVFESQGDGGVLSIDVGEAGEDATAGDNDDAVVDGFIRETELIPAEVAAQRIGVK